MPRFSRKLFSAKLDGLRRALVDDIRVVLRQELEAAGRALKASFDKEEGIDAVKKDFNVPLKGLAVCPHTHPLSETACEPNLISSTASFNSRGGNHIVLNCNHRVPKQIGANATTSGEIIGRSLSREGSMTFFEDEFEDDAIITEEEVNSPSKLEFTIIGEEPRRISRQRTESFNKKPSLASIQEEPRRPIGPPTESFDSWHMRMLEGTKYDETESHLSTDIEVPRTAASCSPGTASLQVERATFLSMLSNDRTIERGSNAFHAAITNVKAINYNKIVDGIASFAIVGNSISFGVQTHVSATANPPSEKAHPVFAVLEMIFCIVFTSELAWRLWHHGLDLYRRKDWQWHVFDTFLVFIQIGDVIMETMDVGASINSMSALRLLRIFRLLRVFRLFRLLRFVTELTIVFAAILGSMRNLLGIIMLLFLIAYCCGIAFCQIATQHRIEAGDSSSLAELRYWWGNMPRSIMTLFQSILGGCDWDNPLQSLASISPFATILYLCYMLFVLLAVMNVITGTFVDTSMRQASRLRVIDFAHQMRGLCLSAGLTDEVGEIQREDFEKFMQHPKIKDCMKEFGIQTDDAETVFTFLDADDSGNIDAEEFYDGLVRLRAGVQLFDMLQVQRDITIQRDEWQTGLEKVHQTIQLLADHIQTLRLPPTKCN